MNDMHLKTVMTVVFLLLGSSALNAVHAGTVSVQSIQISPPETVTGKHPDIIGTVKASGDKASDEKMEVTVIASLARPDNAVKSWTWKKIEFKAGEAKGFSIPKEYDVNLKGVYKVDFSIYTKDMRPLNKLSKSFTVADPLLPPVKTAPQEPIKDKAETSTGKKPDRQTVDMHVGLGAYVNTVNTAGGATILFWPSKYAGFQGSYTVGNFTTTEARLLVRLPVSSGLNPYFGLGYMNVTTERTVDVINIKTTFKDSGVSGVIGVEIPLGMRLLGYVEVSGAAIDLKKEVSSGAQSGTAEVKYAPVTLGVSIVYFAF